MDLADLINLIIAKLGGNRIEFTHIGWNEMADVCEVELIHGSNTYVIRKPYELPATVLQAFKDQGPLTATSYSNWIEGVLNGKVRNEVGDLAEADTGNN